MQMANKKVYYSVQIPVKDIVPGMIIRYHRSYGYVTSVEEHIKRRPHDHDRITVTFEGGHVVRIKLNSLSTAKLYLDKSYETTTTPGKGNRDSTK